LRQYTLAHPGITSGALVPMKSGHAVVFASMRDIGWLDLDSGASDIWRTSPTFGIPFAKLDETHIMFDRTEAMRLRPTSFDIVQETVAPIDFGGDRGLIVPIGERIGFMRRDSSQAWFGDVATAGDAQPLSKVLADQEYQRQLAKLQAMSQATAGMPGVDGGPSLRRMPGLEGVPQEAEVHVVGVYEGRRPSRLPSMAPRQARPVQVILRRSTRPIVLVLASYEPVNWMLENTGATIASVLMSGYHDSSVIGAGNARVLRIGSAYAYTQGGAEYDRLQQAVRQYTGTRGIRSFQGRYEGQAFSVGGY
jgi:hypothetical protein